MYSCSKEPFLSQLLSSFKINPVFLFTHDGQQIPWFNDVKFLKLTLFSCPHDALYLILQELFLYVSSNSSFFIVTIHFLSKKHFTTSSYVETLNAQFLHFTPAPFKKHLNTIVLACPQDAV